MVNRDLVAAKLAELADSVGRVQANRRDSADSLRADRDALELVAFNLLLAVQTCVDLASHLITDEGWPAARSLAEGFTRVEERGVIDAATAGSLRRAVGLRNVVAPGYAGADVELLHAAAASGCAELEAFAQQVAAWTSRAGGA